MRMYWQLVVANVKDMVRDRMSLFWFVAFPLLCTFLFGAIFSGVDDGERTFDIGLVVEDQSLLGHGIVTAFESVPAFNVHRGSEQDELDSLRQGKRFAVVIVPELSIQAMASGSSTEVLVYYDESQQNYVRMVVAAVDDILAEIERRATNAPRLFTTKTLSIHVEEFTTIDYLIPGIIAMASMQLGLFGTFTYVELRERKIIKRLGATPLPRSMVLWAEILVRLVMSVVQCLVILVVGALVFDIKVVGNWIYIIGAVMLGAATFISLGYFLVSFAKTNEAAQGLVQMVHFPMMFLSGIYFPIEIMPPLLKPVMNAMPLTYLGDLMRHNILGLPSQFGVQKDLAILFAWLLVTLWLAIKRFRWE